MADKLRGFVYYVSTNYWDDARRTGWRTQWNGYDPSDPAMAGTAEDNKPRIIKECKSDF